MDHVAIMKKEWGLIPKLISGEKKLESRWYKNKSRPWNCIGVGDNIYFKNSGEPVKIKAKVAEVLQYANLDASKVRTLLLKYAQEDGLGIEDDKLVEFYKRFKDKRYAIFIYLETAQGVEPFDIDKRGFGAMSAWICVDDVQRIKKTQNLDS